MLPRHALTAGALLLLAGPAGTAAGWLADCSKAAIPATPAAGRIKNQAFRVEKAELTSAPGEDRTTYFLTLRQGKDFFADREFKLFLLRPKGQALESAPYVVDPRGVFEMPNPIKDRSGATYPPVQGIHMTAKAAGKTFGDADMQSKFTLRLEFARPGKDGRRPGRIYLCMQDKEKSFVAGTFTATTPK